MSNESKNNEVTLLAETNFRGQRKKFGIRKDDRRRHMYVVGKTGMGKSVFMENMIISDIRAGNGVAVVDPHGDLVEKVIGFVPPGRINDVVYFNPADADFPVAFNILESVDEDKKNLVASGMMGVFKKIWPDVWSPRMEYILNNTILALLDYPGSTMLGASRMMSDKDFRKGVYPKIKDPIVKSFWLNEFEKWDDKFRKEAVAAIQNKVGQFLSSFVIRNIVGQSKSTIDMREIMDGKKILLINLSKGRIGEDAMRLLGGMIITKLQLAAMGRVDIPEEQREDFYLYVDEFQNFATESFASILSEARKYHLNLIVAHQYIEQLSETVKPAIFGNVGTMVVFRVGAEDSEFLAKEFAPQFTETDFVNLTKYNVYMKLMIDGVASTPFSAVTLPPATGREDGNKEKIIKVSREHYAELRAVVEDKIARWSGMVDDGEGGIVIPTGDSFDDEETGGPGKFESVCWACRKKTFVGFQPDGSRPIYCKQCLKKVKKGLIDPNTLRNPGAEAAPVIAAVAPAVQAPASKPFVNKAVAAAPSDFAPSQPYQQNRSVMGSASRPAENIVRSVPAVRQSEARPDSVIRPAVQRTASAAPAVRPEFKPDESSRQFSQPAARPAARQPISARQAGARQTAPAVRQVAPVVRPVTAVQPAVLAEVKIDPVEVAPKPAAQPPAADSVRPREQAASNAVQPAMAPKRESVPVRQPAAEPVAKKLETIIRPVPRSSISLSEAMKSDPVGFRSSRSATPSAPPRPPVEEPAVEVAKPVAAQPLPVKTEKEPVPAPVAENIQANSKIVHEQESEDSFDKLAEAVMQAVAEPKKEQEASQTVTEEPKPAPVAEPEIKEEKPVIVSMKTHRAPIERVAAAETIPPDAQAPPKRSGHKVLKPGEVVKFDD